ncbi:MAG: hypothetical protein B7Y39_08215 [Bdellovibrio sp. 28-41-41]|nr:MAG: hypothetical protein B7Y39_08215 [Bdellovibrio sp. 28-41-41]
MKALGKWLVRILIFVGILVAASVYMVYYSYFHSRTVIGPVSGVKQLLENTAILAGTQDPSSKIYSFAVGVKDNKTQEIVTGSSEDRQWGVVKDGQCVEAVFFPYPPWNLQKAGTYFNVRVHKLYDNCDALPKN